MSNTLRFGSSRDDNLWIECLISHAKNTTDNDCLYSEKYPGRIVLLNDADEWAVDIQNRLEDLEQENAILQHHLDSKIDQCVRLEMQLNKRTVKVTTEFGSDIVFATVQLFTGSEGTQLKGKVLDWNMDGLPMHVEALTPMQEAILVDLASKGNTKVMVHVEVEGYEEASEE